MPTQLLDLKPLSLTFPQTFLPDRDLLARLLRFTAQGGSGTKEAISQTTGIPTGASTGKVEPMIRYALGMGLIGANKTTGGVWQLNLTPLGRVVFQQDAALSEPLTLWLLHLLLCRRCGLAPPASGIADAWFALFAEGAVRLGKRFTLADYLALLQERHGDKASLKALSSLVVRGYSEPRAFGSIGALQEENGYLVRQIAPFKTDFFPAYTAYLYLLWDELFTDRTQLAFDEFASQTRFLALTGWEEFQVAGWLDWMASHGSIHLDRHTGTPVLLRLQATEQALAKLYDGLI
ncbi:hypothetical protein [Methylomagnum sp.]